MLNVDDAIWVRGGDFARRLAVPRTMLSGEFASWRTRSHNGIPASAFLQPSWILAALFPQLTIYEASTK